MAGAATCAGGTAAWRSRRKGACQVGELQRRGCRLAELEPDLHVAAIQIELGDLILLQELDQLFQILDIFWFHSFLYLSPLMRAGLNQSSIRALGAGVSTCPPVRVTATMSSMRMPNWPGKINPGFDGDDHAGQQPRRCPAPMRGDS